MPPVGLRLSISGLHYSNCVYALYLTMIFVCVSVYLKMRVANRVVFQDGL